MNLVSLFLSACISLVSLVSVADASAGAATASLTSESEFLRTSASLAWSGEREAFGSLEWSTVDALPEGEVDLALMTALAAPEPPAIVLAGMALGGLICGRSLLRRTPRTPSTETPR